MEMTKKKGNNRPEPKTTKAGVTRKGSRKYGCGGKIKK